MADIALVFHWPPAAMNEMSLSELALWHELARQRYERQDPTSR